MSKALFIVQLSHSKTVRQLSQQGSLSANYITNHVVSR